jgi:hypothetical protein
LASPRRFGGALVPPHPYAASVTSETVYAKGGLRVKTNGHFSAVNLSVQVVERKQQRPARDASL